VEFILDRASILRTHVGNHTDIIGVVPRAVGSTFPPITCDSSDETASRRVNAISAAQPGYTNTSLYETYAVGRSFGIDCALVTPGLVPFAGTTHVARDMNYVLGILGEEKLSYMGFSYGTVLGATFAALFPDKVERMVLDAVVDVTEYYRIDKDPAFEIGDDLALESIFLSCFNAGPERCAFWYESASQIRDNFYEADRRLQTRPLPVPGFGLLTTPIWRRAVYQALYRPAGYANALAAAAADVFEGVGGQAIQRALGALYGAGTGDDLSLIDPVSGLKNNDNSGYWIPCVDIGGRQSELTGDDLEDIYSKYAASSLLFSGASSQYELFCRGTSTGRCNSMV
jgi:pimeloyl-ACP methyl ester carboxylesterase